MGADFTPTMEGYTGQGAFRFWCQKVLPLVYDDSLSYYEVLCKVVNYLNNTIQDVANVEDNVQSLYEAYNLLQGYVNNYFDSLDVQEEINKKLDEMASDGTLSTIITPLVPDAVSSWLVEHLEPTTPPVDNTLTISGAAADSKVAGDRIREVEDVAENIFKVNSYNYFNFEDNETTSHDITFAADEGTISCSGTASATTVYNFISTYADEHSFDWLKENVKYYVSLNKRGSGNARFRIIGYIDDTANMIYDSMYDGDFVVEDKDIYDGFIARLYIANGTTVDCEFTPLIYSPMSNSDLEKEIKGIEEMVAQNFIPRANNSGSIRGIQWVANNGVYTLTGTATDTAVINIVDTFDGDTVDWLVSGKEYYVEVNKDGSGTVKARLVGYTETEQVGEYINTNIIDTEDYGTFVIPDVSAYDGYIFRLVIPSGETVNCTVYPVVADKYSIKALSEISAELVEKQDTTDEMIKYNAVNMLKEFTFGDIDRNGLRIGSENGTYYIRGIPDVGESDDQPGTATATTTYNILNTANDANAFDWLESGKTYYINFNKIGTGAVRIRLQGYDANNTYTYFDAENDGSFVIPDKSILTQIIFRLYIYNGTSNIVCHITPKILTALSNQSISVLINENNKIRVMQNNIGVFRYGHKGSSSLETYGLSPELTNYKLQNYKNFYGKIEPDILCLQEYTEYVDKAQSVSCNTNLFEPIFKYTSEDKRIRSKYPIIYSTHYLTNPFVSGEKSDTLYYSMAKVDIRGKTVTVISTALLPSAAAEINDPDNIQIRYDQFIWLLDRFSNEEYVVVCIDINVDSKTELENLISNAGNYKFASSFWGTKPSYMNHAGAGSITYFSCLDHIFVKGNIEFNCFENCYDSSTEFGKYGVFHPREVIDKTENLMTMTNGSGGGHGVTYAINNGKITFTASEPTDATYVVNIHRFPNEPNAFDWLIDGMTYDVEPNLVGDSGILLRLYPYIDSTAYPYFDSSASGSFTCYNKETFNYIYLRFYVPSGWSGSCEFTPTIKAKESTFMIIADNAKNLLASDHLPVYSDLAIK